MSIKAKYRPYFSEYELQETIRCLKTASNNFPLIRYLETFQLKIQAGLQEPNLILSPIPTMEDKLELGSVLPVSVGSVSVLRYNSYLKWKESPESCTSKELSLAYEYRYEKSLMSFEEETKFEQSFLNS